VKFVSMLSLTRGASCDYADRSLANWR